MLLAVKRPKGMALHINARFRVIAPPLLRFGCLYAAGQVLDSGLASPDPNRTIRSAKKITGYMIIAYERESALAVGRVSAISLDRCRVAYEHSLVRRESV